MLNNKRYNLTPKVCSHNQTDKRIFFENLDGLRFVAFALVLVQHNFFPYVNTLHDNKTYGSKLLIILLSSGQTGVSIFFVLSGFLITYLLLHEKETKERINLPNFYMRRVLRIWPLFYLVLIVVFIIFPCFKILLGNYEHYHSNPWYYITFLSNFNVLHDEMLYLGHNNPMQGVTWSVSVEEQFYLIWPLLFVFVPGRLYKFIFPSVIIGSLLFRFFHRNDDLVLYYHTLSVISDMAMGGLFAYIVYYNKGVERLFRSLNQHVIILVYLLGLIWLLLGNELLNQNEFKIFFRLINSAFFGFVLFEQNYSNHSFYKFSTYRFFSFWGKYTYGLYLLHELAIAVTIIALRIILHWPETGELKYTIVKFITSFLLSLGMSYASYEYFEKPFLKLKNRFASH